MVRFRSGKPPSGKRPGPPQKPALRIQTTTLWEYPSQHYGTGEQGSKSFEGATPSYVVWNLLQRYTREGELAVDPFAGSGTTLDVAKDTRRRSFGSDIAPFRKDIIRADARQLPLRNQAADFIFMDPPYGTHLEYSGDARCIGELSTRDGSYYRAMADAFKEAARVLRPGRFIAVYVSDSFEKGKPFSPIGFELFGLLQKRFEPVDVVAVVRHNRKLQLGNWHKAAEEGNFFLRGFNYLLLFRKK